MERSRGSQMPHCVRRHHFRYRRWASPARGRNMSETSRWNSSALSSPPFELETTGSAAFPPCRDNLGPSPGERLHITGIST